MKIYLSGPMTGLPDFNYPTFNETAAMLRGRGHSVYNPADFPHDFNKGPFPIRKAFAEFSKFICEEADAIYMMRGWEKSKGALAEYHLALNCELLVLKQV